MDETPTVRLAAIALLFGGILGCATLPFPGPRGRSGTLTTEDGAPVANAEVIVHSWRTAMPGRFRIGHENTYTTRTDDQGRWTVPSRASVHFVIALPDAIPVIEDDYTFRVAGQPDLNKVFDWPWPHRPEETSLSTMRADGSGPPPLSVLLMPGFGAAVGGGLTVSAHLGGMAIATRGGFGAGLRAAVEPGVSGVAGAAGAVIIPVGGAMPSLGVELNARYLRPWTVTAGARPEWGPEIAFDFMGYRFTIAAHGHEIGAPLGGRRFVFGFGFGYF